MKSAVCSCGHFKIKANAIQRGEMQIPPLIALLWSDKYYSRANVWAIKLYCPIHMLKHVGVMGQLFSLLGPCLCAAARTAEQRKRKVCSVFASKGLRHTKKHRNWNISWKVYKIKEFPISCSSLCVINPAAGPRERPCRSYHIKKTFCQDGIRKNTNT